MKNLAIVGAAHIHTPNFLKMLVQRTDFQVQKVWDHSLERAARNVDILKTKTCSSPDEIWQDPDIDAVIICSETNRHKDLVLSAAAAGKHLFVEKPLGMTGNDARMMAAAIRKAGVLFQTGYFMRGNPIYRFLKEQIQKGTFGKITRIRLSNCHAGSLRGLFDQDWRWMADPEIAGCGAFGDLGTHSLDLLLWMLGSPSEVTAQIRIVTGRYPGCDETGEALLCYPDGCLASIAAGWVDIANPIAFQLSGTDGHAFILDSELYLKTDKLPGADGLQAWTDLPEALPHAFDLFLNALYGQKVSLVSAEEAALRNVVMEALYTAAKQQSWEKIGCQAGSQDA
ncbi:MAG: Gfo/Idh/MocA family oxidoreductase [Lentisphaeria bacterium]